MVHDSVLGWIHDDCGDPQYLCGERCHHGERCLHDVRIGVEICEACHEVGSEVVFGEICPGAKPTVVEVGFVVSRLLKGADEEQLSSGGRDLELVNDHVVYDANQGCGCPNVDEVHDDVQGHVCGCGWIWKVCVRWSKCDGLPGIDEADWTWMCDVKFSGVYLVRTFETWYEIGEYVQDGQHVGDSATAQALEVVAVRWWWSFCRWWWCFSWRW